MCASPPSRLSDFVSVVLEYLGIALVLIGFALAFFRDFSGIGVFWSGVALLVAFLVKDHVLHL